MDNSSKIGNKADNLLFLKKEGFNVPNLFVLQKNLSEKDQSLLIKKGILKYFNN